MRARPTIKDIAAEVGVSHTTVSYILSGNTTQKISPETRKAVLDASNIYNKFMAGEVIPEPPSPFQRAGRTLTGALRPQPKTL